MMIVPWPTEDGHVALEVLAIVLGQDAQEQRRGGVGISQRVVCVRGRGRGGFVGSQTVHRHWSDDLLRGAIRGAKVWHPETTQAAPDTRQVAEIAGSRPGRLAEHALHPVGRRFDPCRAHPDEWDFPRTGSDGSRTRREPRNLPHAEARRLARGRPRQAAQMAGGGCPLVAACAVAATRRGDTPLRTGSPTQAESPQDGIVLRPLRLGARDTRMQCGRCGFPGGGQPPKR
jgi:hypothetical protein